MFRALLLALLALGGAAPALAVTLTTSRPFSVDDARIVSVEFPAGELTISSGDGDLIEATMTARCSSPAAEERARRIRLVSEMRGDTRAFRVEGMRKFPPQPSLSLHLVIPRWLAVQVHMGAGDVDVRDVLGNVELELGAGDVTVRAPRQRVQTVRVHVGVGDANLRVGPRAIEGRGFLSKNLHWTNDAGLTRVDVELGVGDVDVALR